jgi:MFS family permease
VPEAVGLVLGAFALGSLLSGLAYGAHTWRSALRQRFVLSVLALAAGTLPFAVVGSVPLLTVAVFVAGLAISPMVISGFGLVEAAMPPARLTEGLTVAGTAIGLGAAMGAAASGPVIDAYDASRAFLVTCGFGAVAAVTVALAARALVPQDTPA